MPNPTKPIFISHLIAAFWANYFYLFHISTPLKTLFLLVVSFPTVSVTPNNRIISFNICVIYIFGTFIIILTRLTILHKLTPLGVILFLSFYRIYKNGQVDISLVLHQQHLRIHKQYNHLCNTFLEILLYQ